MILCLLISAVLAAEHNPPGPPASRPAATAPAADTEAAVKGIVEDASRTRHRVTIAGREIPYTATAANMLMKDEAGKLKASVFFIAYEAEPSDGTQGGKMDPALRPITFVFNGGPGAAAVWLHLGTAGPLRISLEEDGRAPPPPYGLVENEFSWLDATDMVFIDPVGTGYSRPAEGEKGEQFYGVREDIRWVADFIRLYTTQYERWLSPKFLAGESYGTTRAAGLSEHLIDRYGITLNGIMLISSVLDFQTLSPGEMNDLPYVLFLPTYTAIAHYHGRLGAPVPEDLDRLLREVEAWASTEYLVALSRGNALGAEARRDVVARLARYTGLSPEFIDRSNLRVRPGAFQKQLLLAERRLVGRFDGRIIGFDPDPTSLRPTYDPSLSQYLAVYSSTFNDYARRTLKFESTLPYEVLSDKVHPWKYPEGQGYLSVADDLSSAMIKSPYLKVLFASGYYDLATPYYSSRYTIDHLQIGPDLRRNVMHTLYHGGHMMYHNAPALRQLHEDVARFIRSALPERGPAEDSIDR